MSLLIGDICLQADVDIEIIATIQLFLHNSLLWSTKKTCPPHQILQARNALTLRLT